MSSFYGGGIDKQKDIFVGQQPHGTHNGFNGFENQFGNYQSHNITSKYIVSRAFKKLEEHIRISREIIEVDHQLIILKGKNAEDEIKQLNINFNYSYTLKKSITSPDSKIVIIDIKK